MLDENKINSLKYVIISLENNVNNFSFLDDEQDYQLNRMIEEIKAQHNNFIYTTNNYLEEEKYKLNQNN